MTYPAPLAQIKNKYICKICSISSGDIWTCHARIQTVLLEGIQLWPLFRSWGERGSKYHLKRNETPLPFRWRANDGPTLNDGLVALWSPRGSRPVMIRNPIAFWFSRGVRTPAPPPLWIRACLLCSQYMIRDIGTCCACSI